MNLSDINLLDVFFWAMRANFYIANIWWVFIAMFAVALLGGKRYRKNLERRHAKQAEAERAAAEYDEQYPDSYQDD